MTTRTAFEILTVPILFAAQSLIAQTPRPVVLDKPMAELRGTFTSISSLRELSDGRVIVSDGRDKLVQLADFKAQTLTKIGRDGSGPGEFKSAGKLHALPGDTTLMEDFVNGRLLIINPDGKAGATRSENQGPFPNASSIGMDDVGATYLTVSEANAKESGGSQLIIRYNPRTKQTDTIATTRHPSGLQSGASSLGGGMLKFFTNLPFASEDAAAVSRDGRVAVARSENYHLEWYARDGRKTVGPVVKFAPIEITTAEKRAFLEKQVRPGSITVQSNPGGVSVPIKSSPNKPLYTAETYDDKGMTWPARKPPFVGNAVSIDGAGRAWVLRTTPYTATGLTYDVFDATAKPVLSVTLPPKTKLAGFGPKTLYLAFSDEDDLQHLHLYSAPQ